MKFRSRFFGVLFLISLAWVCYGLTLSSAAFSNTVAVQVTPSGNLSAEDTQALRTAGAGIGAGLGVTFFLCSGLPFALLFGLLSWRNAAGETNARRHREQLAAIQNAKGSNP
jgi:hypothetical protein